VDDVDAITIPRSGGPEVLTWATVPDPEPGPGEVLLDVAASAVNRADLMQREGLYPPPPGAPPYLGLECAGRIAALGDGVTGWAVGDAVCALLAGGGYATKVAVPAGQLLPIPGGLDETGAAALPEVACTVWSTIGDIARLTKGETFLVHGGSSGIGTHAIQLGVALGARVLCTAGSAEKLAACRELGADVAINYRTEDFVQRVKDETGVGADVVLDMVGAPYLARNIDALAPNGRLAIIGMQGGTKAEFDLNSLMRKRASVIATALRARPLAEKAAIVARVREVVWPMVEVGAIRPVVDRVVPMRDAAEAHRVVESGHHIGKVVLAAV
jgi:putative PIG3 family NAD(P)H quinone oxidoreductase